MDRTSRKEEAMEPHNRRLSARGTAYLATFTLTLFGLAGGSVLPVASSSLYARSAMPPFESHSRSMAQPLPQATSGGRLVFERVDVHSPTQAGTGIYIMEADGTNLRRLNSVGFAPALSRDGTKLGFVTGQTSSGCNNYELNIMPSIFGTDRRPLTKVCGYDQHPAWSPDGTKLAFWSDRDAGEGLYVMNADGSQQTRILSTSSIQRLIESPHWSPDGTRITFVGYNLDANNEADIFVVNADGSNPVNITNTPTTHEVAPAWSRDNNKIAYIRITSPDNSDIYTMNTDGSNQSQLTNLSITGLGIIIGFGQLKLAWSPDGMRLAFMDVGNSLDIFAVDADGTHRVNLTNTQDNDTYPDWQVAAPAPTTNPIDDTEFFVRQHYSDFLNRVPDAAGLAHWVNQITECQQPGATCNAEVRRINVSAAFFLSIEFQETGYLVYRIYKAAYGNLSGLPVPIRYGEFLPDTQQIGQGVVVGQTGWEPALENNKVAFAMDFVSRSRFEAALPTTMTPAQLVDALYQNAGVTPVATERTSVINEFGSGTTTTDTAARARVLRRVAENTALKQQEFNRAFVLMQYFGYLRRNPDDAPDTNFDGYNFWLAKLLQFNGNFVNAEMVKAFLNSDEYRQRFGP